VKWEKKSAENVNKVFCRGRIKKRRTRRNYLKECGIVTMDQKGAKKTGFFALNPNEASR